MLPWGPSTTTECIPAATRSVRGVFPLSLSSTINVPGGLDSTVSVPTRAEWASAQRGLGVGFRFPRHLKWVGSGLSRPIGAGAREGPAALVPRPAAPSRVPGRLAEWGLGTDTSGSRFPVATRCDAPTVAIPAAAKPADNSALHQERKAPLGRPTESESRHRCFLAGGGIAAGRRSGMGTGAGGGARDYWRARLGETRGFDPCHRVRGRAGAATRLDSSGRKGGTNGSGGRTGGGGRGAGSRLGPPSRRSRPVAFARERQGIREGSGNGDGARATTPEPLQRRTSVQAGRGSPQRPLGKLLGAFGGGGMGSGGSGSSAPAGPTGVPPTSERIVLGGGKSPPPFPLAPRASQCSA